MTAPTTTTGQTYLLTVEATATAPTLPGLRRLLKALGRSYGLRVVGIRRSGDAANHCNTETYGGGSESAGTPGSDRAMGSTRASSLESFAPGGTDAS